jgi:hypothetical protein
MEVAQHFSAGISISKTQKSVKRTTEKYLTISVVRFTDYKLLSDLNPALKCWAIFNRPLRGRQADPYFPAARNASLIICRKPSGFH